MTAPVRIARPTDTWFDAAMDVIVVRTPRGLPGRHGSVKPAQSAPWQLSDIGTTNSRGLSYG